ncbi:MAG TPA: cytochrome c oxidase subunit II [Candidatus Limnocylindria bacterium]|nr:cytochrome c oxidase subunit II [Candidatus Limnocylindria bacterium]
MRPPAEAIGALALVVGGIALLIFIGVEGALIYAVWRYRSSRSSAGEPARFERNTRLEIAWTAAPALVLAVVFVLMLGTMAEIGGAAVEPGLRVRAVGHQWWWEFGYGGVTTANELHIPVATAVELELTSADVIHSFWVPELGGKRDMLPGTTNHLRLFARRAGVYEGQCAEFCGVEHAWMRIRVVAESQSDFDRWVASQAQPAATRGGEGERVFLANICVNCHTLRGTVAVGTAGPDLTHVGARTALAAGALPNDVARMRAWLADPQQHKPGALMPQVPLSDTELDALAAYLASLK